MQVKIITQPYVLYDSIGHVVEATELRGFKITMIGTLLLYCIVMVDHSYLKESLYDS